MAFYCYFEVCRIKFFGLHLNIFFCFFALTIFYSPESCSTLSCYLDQVFQSWSGVLVQYWPGTYQVYQYIFISIGHIDAKCTGTDS